MKIQRGLRASRVRLKRNARRTLDSGSSALKNTSRKGFIKLQRSQKLSKLFHADPASKIRAERNLSTTAKHKVRHPDLQIAAHEQLACATRTRNSRKHRPTA